MLLHMLEVMMTDESMSITDTVNSLLFLQVGPAVVQAFHNFLVRLQLRCTDDAENHLKQLLLRLVSTLSSES
jgi:hypothetical protein